MDNSQDYGAYGSRSAFLFHELLRKEMPGGEGRRSYKKGDFIFEEGKHTNGLFCIISGKVKITRHSDTGKEQILRLAGPRDIIGYRGLLGGEQYRASAIALEDAVVGYVPKKIFFDILNESPEVSRHMMQLLCQELDRSDSSRVDIATKTVRERLAEVLLLLAETYGFQDDEITIDLNLTREELAGMVGAVKEVVIRALAAMKEEGCVNTKGRQIQIADKKALIRIARISD